jgi:hypothetical protein
VQCIGSAWQSRIGLKENLPARAGLELRTCGGRNSSSMERAPTLERDAPAGMLQKDILKLANWQSAQSGCVMLA